MALREAGMITTALAANTLQLATESNTSYRVRRILVQGAPANSYLTAQIDNTQVGYFRTDAGVGNMLSSGFAGLYHTNLLDELTERKLFTGFPVANGQTFNLNLSSGTANIVVFYDEYDAADVKTTEPDGTDATQRLVILYGENSAAIAEGTYGEIDTSLSPVGYTKFPFSTSFPVRFTGQLLSVFLRDVSENLYTGNADTIVETQYARLTMNQEVLFDLSKHGFLAQGAGAANGSANTKYGGGMNVIPFPRDDQEQRLHFFEQPITFVGGDELSLEVSVAGAAGASLPADSVLVALPMLMKVGK